MCVCVCELIRAFKNVNPGHAKFTKTKKKCTCISTAFRIRVRPFHHNYVWDVNCYRDAKRRCSGRIFLSYPHTNNGFFFLLKLFIL